MKKKIILIPIPNIFIGRITNKKIYHIHYHEGLTSHDIESLRHVTTFSGYVDDKEYKVSNIHLYKYSTLYNKFKLSKDFSEIIHTHVHHKDDLNNTKTNYYYVYDNSQYYNNTEKYVEDLDGFYFYHHHYHFYWEPNMLSCNRYEMFNQAIHYDDTFNRFYDEEHVFMLFEFIKNNYIYKIYYKVYKKSYEYNFIVKRDLLGRVWK